MERRLGVCNLCEAICGLELTVADGAVVGVRGSPADPLSRGHLCPKGVAMADIQSDPDRLRRPVRRTGGTWTEIGWDEAFDLVAERVARVVDRHGWDALGVYLGNPNVHSLGSMTHGVAMSRALRTRNRFSATSVDQLPAQLVAHLMFGHQLLLPIPDIDRTSYFLVFGANPVASNGSLMTAPGFPRRVRALTARGGRMVVFDPRRTETATLATEHHFVRPGSDAWVLLAMLQVLFAEGLTRIPAYAGGSGDLREAVAGFPPERAAGVSGVPAATIRRLAREFASADGAVAYGRVGTSTQRFGTLCQWALTCLNVVTGNLDRVGGAMFTSPAVDLVGTGLVGPGHHDRWRSRVRGLPETSGELPVAALRGEIETPGPGQIRAMLTVAGNPVLSTPDGARLERALAGLEFMASIDLFVNETTRHADVILPPTTALERDHYDLVFHALAVRNTARFTPAVLQPPPDSRHDWQIYREITLRTLGRLGRLGRSGSSGRSGRLGRLGRLVSLGRPTTWRRRLLLRARMSVPPTVLVGLLLRRGRSGVTLRRLRRHPEGVDLGPLRPGQLPARLGRPDRRVQLAPDLVIADLRRLEAGRTEGGGFYSDEAGGAAPERGGPDPEGVRSGGARSAGAPSARARSAGASSARARSTGVGSGGVNSGGPDDQQPESLDQLLLIGRRHQQDCNSWLHNSARLTRGRPRHQLLVHPDDLAARGLADGVRVSVSSRVGSVVVDARASTEMMRGVVSLPHGYGHRRDGVLLRRAAELPGASINDLTDPELLDVSGNAALSGVPVTIAPA